MENSPSPPRPTSAPWWRLPLLLALVLAAIVWWRVHKLREVAQEPKTDRAAPVVDASSHERIVLAIDFGGGRRKNFDAAGWRDGMTVADLMKATAGLNIVQKGTGESAFLTTIDGVENQGDAGHNWTYAVNGKSADRSFAIYKLQPGDQVLWKFGPRQ